MLHQGNVNNVSDGNVHGVSHLVDEIWCWVDNYRQPYTGNQDIVSSLAQWELTKSHGWPSPGLWYN